MKTAKVIAYFGSNLSAVGRAAGVSRQAVQQWGEFVPEHTAWQLHSVHKKLDFGAEDYALVESTRRSRIRQAMVKRTLLRSRRAPTLKKPPPPEPSAAET